MFTTGQFTKKVGIETNTMIRWLREGIIVPQPIEGRNNQFSFEEMLVARSIAPLYLEWSIRSEILADVASFMRSLVSIREELGYATHDEFWREIQHWRASAISMLASKDSASAEEFSGAVKAIEHQATKNGVTLRENWQTSYEKPSHFAGATLERIKNYESVAGHYFGSGGHGWFLFLSRDDEGTWNWALSGFDGFRDQFQGSANSFIAVDLSKALKAGDI